MQNFSFKHLLTALTYIIKVYYTLQESLTGFGFYKELSNNIKLIFYIINLPI